jgi:hypothetical protein
LYERLHLLEKDELRTINKGRREFKKKLKFLNEIEEVFLKTLEVLSHENVQLFSSSQDASYRVSHRIFRIVRCVSKCSLNGYYDVSMALLRIAYENHLLMKYLSENEEQAKLWFQGKRFTPSLLRHNVSYASNSLYQEMSEFIHSSFKSTYAFTEIEKDRTKAVIGEYNREQFKQVLVLMLVIMETTIIWLSLTFAQELMKNEQWHSVFRATVPKLWKSLKSEISSEH